VTLGILAYRGFFKYLITIQEFTICLNISIILLKEKLKFIQKPFNGILPNSLNIAKLVLVLLAPSIYLQK
jgi:hypothetical protein